VSGENLEVVKRAIAALNQRDIDRYLACCTPTIELRMPMAPIESVYQGPEGIRRWWADTADVDPGAQLQLEHLEAVGENRAFAFWHITGRGRSSGVPFEGDAASVYTFVDAKIDRIEVFLDREEALEAVGLRE
jgi:ketosteroid isomerase-like protein